MPRAKPYPYQNYILLKLEDFAKENLYYNMDKESEIRITIKQVKKKKLILKTVINYGLKYKKNVREELDN